MLQPINHLTEEGYHDDVSSSSLLRPPSTKLYGGIIEVSGEGDDRKRKELSMLPLLAVTSFNIGINFGWAAFFVLAAPAFLSLNLSPTMTSIATASGPISGFLQPFLGKYSDTFHSRWGKRRPFILLGLILGLVGMLLFANYETIGSLADKGEGREEGKSGGSNWLKVFIAVISLWIFNIGLNIIQFAGIALTLDVCVTEEEKSKGTSLQSSASGLASLLANCLVFVNFVSFAPFFGTNDAAVFYIGFLIVLLSTLPTLFLNERDYLSTSSLSSFTSPSSTSLGSSPPSSSSRSPLLSSIDPPSPSPSPSSSSSSCSVRVSNILCWFRSLPGETWGFIKKINTGTWRLVFLWFCTNTAMYPWQIYFTAYVGEDVYHGEPGSGSGSISSSGSLQDLYDEGVRVGSLAVGLTGLVQMLSALILTPWVNLCGNKFVYFVAMINAAVCYILPAWPRMMRVPPAIALAGCSGLFQAITGALPFSILGLVVPEEELGIWVGLMNAVQVAAQLLISLLAGVVMEHFAYLGLGQIGVGIAFGGLFALVGIPLVFLLKIPNEKPFFSSSFFSFCC